MIKVKIDVTSNRTFKDLALLFDSIAFQNKFDECRADYKRTGNLKPILYRYRYPAGFAGALISVFNKGVVTDFDVKNCYSKIFLFLLTGGRDESFTFTKDELVISIYAHGIKRNKKAILKEVSKALDDALIRVEPLHPNHPLLQDVKSNIREIREMYWDRKLNNTSTATLAEKYSKEENTVNKEISEYKKLLLLLK
jgi:hypothetical protein